MKFYKILLVVVLVLCAFGAYAQDVKYFKFTIVQDLRGNKHFIVGNKINGTSEIVNQASLEGNITLFRGQGEIKDGKIIWVKEQNVPVFRNFPDKPSRYVVEPGKGIDALKSFLESNEGSAIKNKYFTPTTEYIASNETNRHMTADLSTLVSLFNGSLSEKLLFLYKYVQNTAGWIKSDTEKANETALMQNRAKEIIKTYEFAISIDPSLETSAYEEVKPYLDKMLDNGFSLNNITNNSGEYNNFEAAIKLLTNDLRTTFNKALKETTIVVGLDSEYPFRTSIEPQRLNNKMEPIIKEAVTILDDGKGHQRWYDGGSDDVKEKETSYIFADLNKSKYEAIKALVNLLKAQRITSTTFNTAELLVLRLTLQESRNIVSGVSLAEFEPDYKEGINPLQFVKTNLEMMLGDVIKAQQSQWVKEVAKDATKGAPNTAKVEGMLEYSEKVFLEASSNNSELFCIMFGNLERLKEFISKPDVKI